MLDITFCFNCESDLCRNNVKLQEMMIRIVGTLLKDPVLSLRIMTEKIRFSLLLLLREECTYFYFPQDMENPVIHARDVFVEKMLNFY